MNKKNEEMLTGNYLDEPNFSSADLSASKIHLREAIRHPLLSKEETVELIKRSHAGDNSAREKLADCNLRLVLSFLKPYLNRGVSYDDLVQEGNMGLLRAIDKYKPDCNISFSSFAHTWICQALGRAIQNDGRTIHIANNVQEKAAKMWKAKKGYELENGSIPDSDELSIYMNGELSSEDINDINDIFYKTNVDSLDREVYEDTPMYEVVSYKESEEDNESSYRMNNYKKILYNALSKLDSRSAYIVGNLNQIEGYEGLDLDELSIKLGLGKERIRQIRKDAEKQLYDICNNKQ